MDSSVISLHVVPKASKDAIAGWHGGALKIKVRAAPENGRANKAVIDLLAKMLGVPKSAVTIASGHASRHKRIQITGLSSAAVQERLQAMVAAS